MTARKTEAVRASIRGLENGNNYIKIQELLKNLEGYSVVKNSLLQSLTDDCAFLDCLRTLGIENWDKYDEAKEMYYDEE